MKTIPSAVSGCNPSDGLSPAMLAIHARLVELIRAAQDVSPFEHQGEIWAQPLSQGAWCKAGDFALRTFQELIKVPPIRRYRCKVEGRVTTLLRIGDPGTEAHRECANAMKRFYMAKTSEAKIRGDQFGMLHGLAQNFPDGYQLAIFKHTLFRWSAFMDDAAAEIDAALNCYAGGFDPFAPGADCNHMLTTARRFYWRQSEVKRRVLRYPNIDFLLAFWPVAVELFIDDHQRSDGGHPARIWGRWSDRQRCYAESISLRIGR